MTKITDKNFEKLRQKEKSGDIKILILMIEPLTTGGWHFLHGEKAGTTITMHMVNL